MKGRKIRNNRYMGSTFYTNKSKVSAPGTNKWPKPNRNYKEEYVVAPSAKKDSNYIKKSNLW